MVPSGQVFFKSFCSNIGIKKNARSLDSRRGPLGDYFDDFYAYLKAKGYSHSVACGQCSRWQCCQFNAYLIYAFQGNLPLDAFFGTV